MHGKWFIPKKPAMKTLIPKSSYAVVILLLMIFSASCSKMNEEELPTEPVPINLSEGQVSLISSGNSFAFELFKSVLNTSTEDENIIISPLSVSVALSMTLNGASGQTHEDMVETLGISGLSDVEINQAYRDLVGALLEVDKRVNMQIANSVWIEQYFTPEKPFIDVLKEYYNAETGEFDITDPGAPALVNGWIEEKTNGLIKNMIDRFSDNTVMLLVNAIYFKARWQEQFDKSMTQQAPFSKWSGTSVSVPMMNQQETFRISEGNGFVFAELPYGQGNYVMDVLLPVPGAGTSSLLPLLDDDQYRSLVTGSGPREADLSMPRFKFGFKSRLKDILTDMGMGVAFTDQADFSRISELDLLLNEVLHQAFIETNEEGTEAAAATVVEVGLTSAPPEPMEIKLDHPFLFLIRETTTNTILFMGRVSDPLAE